MFKIGVIGSIGVGKSTFINYLVQEINNLGVKTYVYGEPAMEDEATHKILLKFYEDTKKYAFALESSITKFITATTKKLMNYVVIKKKGLSLLTDLLTATFIRVFSLKIISLPMKNNLLSLMKLLTLRLM